MARRDEGQKVIVRGQAYMVVATDEGRMTVWRDPDEVDIGSMLLAENGVWGVVGDDYQLTSDIASQLRRRS